ncbi:MAG: 4a-hydroxytetrahydrobiopterin dehydratase [Chloroflexi bacterium]|nr:4a-hydroxytetrahydrobiopterin dehydratase [Chloroflexota bacterium]
MSSLIDMNCVPVRSGDPQATAEESAQYMQEVPEWETIAVDGVNHLQRVYKFQNFVDALSFTNKIGALAEQQDHHPALVTEWGKVTVTWWTHVIKGLHTNDFVSAAKSDQIYAP